MYFSACSRISCRRQCHSLFLVMRVPSSLTNGSGSLLILGSADGSINAGTSQSALEFSTSPEPPEPLEPPPVPAPPPAPALVPPVPPGSALPPLPALPDAPLVPEPPFPELPALVVPAVPEVPLPELPPVELAVP